MSMFDRFLGHLHDYDESNLRNDRIEEIANDVWEMANRMAEIAEADCNRGLSREEKREDTRLEMKIVDLLQEINPDIRVQFSGDPRGHVVRVLFPLDEDENRPYNTWGGMDHGFGIGD